MSIIYRFLVFLLLLLGGGVAASQQRPIVKYTVREGLVQNQVLSFLKDSRGYVWCGTWYGLSRFNGETFENYTETQGLWNARVTDIVEDDSGRIWVSDGGHRLATFDGANFKLFSSLTDNFSGLHFNRRTKSVRLWNDDKKELWEVKGDTLLPLRLPGFPKAPETRPYYHAGTDSYLFIQNRQIVSYRDGKVIPLTDQGEWEIGNSVHDEIHISDKNPNGNSQYYVIRRGQIIPFLSITPKGFTLSAALPYHYVFNSQNALYYLPPNSVRAERISESPPSSGPINFLNQQASSMLWIPTEQGLWGLMLTGFKNFREGEVPYAWSVVEDSQGKMLFLNYGKGLQEFDGERLRYIPQKEYHSKKVAAYKPLKTIPGPDYWYYRALRDRNGYCWLPTNAGLFRYKNSKWDFIRKGSWNLAFSIAEDVVRQKIVVAGYQHFYSVDIAPPFSADSIRGQSKLFENLLLCTAVSPKGDYWFSGRGIERYDPDTKKFTSYTFENGKLPGKGAYMLYFDWNGTLWAGDKGQLIRYNPATDRFEKAFDFKFHQIVQFAEQIDEDHLLIGDMQNIYVLNLKKFNASGEVNIKTFNHHNGFMGMEPGQLGSYRDSQGKIWITSGSVLSVLDPRELDLTTRPLRTMFAKVNKLGVSFTHPNELIEIGEGESIINIKVETLGDDKTYNSQFSYWLEGDMDAWTDWQEQPLITLSNLSNGVHTLRVRSRSGDFNAHDASIATLRFRTKVAFWRSPNFYLYASLVGLFLLIALGLLWRRDRRKGRALLTQQRLLEKRERTLRLLQAQTIQSQMSPHFTSNVLGAIQHQILNNEPEQASDNLVKLSRLSRAYLEDSLMENGHDSFLTRDIPLGREVRLLTMYVELMQLWHQDRFDFVLDIQSSLKLGDHTIPPFLIQPFVENAIEHGLIHRLDKGTLRVQFLALANEVLVCQIEDDGIGREAARLQQHQTAKEFASVSINLSQQRAALLNQLGYAIQIKIEDRVEGTGTVVTVQIGYT